MAFFGGVPEVLVPDNLKAGVKSPCRYEPDLNPAYHDLAQHYGVAVLPTRVRKPRDKAKVEVGVQVVERWILARLRDRAVPPRPVSTRPVALSGSLGRWARCKLGSVGSSAASSASI